MVTTNCLTGLTIIVSLEIPLDEDAKAFNQLMPGCSMIGDQGLKRKQELLEKGTELNCGIAAWDIWMRATVISMAEKHFQCMDLIKTALGRPCETRVKAKQTNSPTKGWLAKTEEHLAFHFNLVGPIQPPTLDKSNYTVSFVVERSKFARV